LLSKRLQLLHELLSAAKSIALLVNPTNPGAMYPIIGIVRCCARATTGHAAAPPSPAMNSRRRMLNPRS
jgi:hypothetical protein